MWVKIAEIILFHIVFLLINISPVTCHVPSYASTPSNKIEQFCQLSEACIHDTIAVCGKMGEEQRTFLDLCDLLEYACDHNQIFSHVDDMPGCPEVEEDDYYIRRKS
ncbi:uncharacterized protein LOC113499538 [Trichoplusia ni]|uniref:Uncharacterized protein LOC113499538 n=1 Tax=Trichoplusia ni TaxID=7111 RepID=A0A7E5W5U0_TRINI|nr:uncharacterized protein LOC113499538 [Trichoplusia ni]